MVRDGVVGGLVLVAAQAEAADLASGEALGLATMRGVAEGTLPFHDRLVFRDSAVRLGSESFVAPEAEILWIRGQQRGPIRGVGRMAGHALALGDRGMGMRHLSRGSHTLVAREAKRRRGSVKAEGLFSGRGGRYMARAASSLGHGWMGRLL